jgi:hypothetical protein
MPFYILNNGRARVNYAKKRYKITIGKILHTNDIRKITDIDLRAKKSVYFCEFFFTDFCGKKKRPVTKALLILQIFQSNLFPSQMVFVCIQSIYKSILQTKLYLVSYRQIPR